MKSYDEVVKLKQPLESDYLDRHEAHRKLRNFWHGRYWDEAEADKGGVSSIFRDLTSRQSDVGPDIKLVYNVLKDVSVKFQSFLAPLPMIRMYVDPPSTANRRNQATIKERYLYGQWAYSKMTKVMSDNGWYLPLMGDAFLCIYPDLNSNNCRAYVRSPEWAYPLYSYDMEKLDGVIFCWKAKQSAVKRAFPEYVVPPKRDSVLRRGRRGGASDPEVEVMEYSDRFEFSRFFDGQRAQGVEHNFGFNLAEHVKFINVPGEVWGHGAVEQAVNLVEMGNAYLSLMMQSAIENVFPVMVIKDPMKAPEELERGAGAVIPVGVGGDVTYLVPPGGNLLANAQWAQEIERMVKTDTSMPDVNFGNFQASIVTGKAINELQGAGTGSLVEMVQGVSIGSALVGWNEKAIHIARTMFKDDKIHLFGHEAAGIAEVNPRHFSMTIKGSQLVGSSRNEVVFMPHLDMHSKVVMGLQLSQAGLVSKQWQREQVGIPDSEAMDEEIVSEAIQGAALQALLQAMVDPTMGQEVEANAVNVIEGAPIEPPILSISGPSVPGAPGPGQGQLPPGAPPGAPPQVPPSPAGAPPPGQPGAEPAPQEGTGGGVGSGQGVPLDAAISAFQSVQGVQGRVFLVGEIVAVGSTTDTIEAAVTMAEDRQVLSDGLPFPVNFRVVEDVPSEPYVEVTPGASPVTGGEEPQPNELIEE